MRLSSFFCSFVGLCVNVEAFQLELPQIKRAHLNNVRTQINLNYTCTSHLAESAKAEISRCPYLERENSLVSAADRFLSIVDSARTSTTLFMNNGLRKSDSRRRRFVVPRGSAEINGP